MNLKILSIVGLVFYFSACSTAQDKKKIDAENEAVKSWTETEYFMTGAGDKIKKVTKEESEWESDLGEQEFYVIRKKGTERSFTSDLLNIKKEGVYTCKACDFPLFASGTKFKSGSGWPSFYEPIEDVFILKDTDYNLGYGRTEVMCMRCKGHLGHVFNDGPKPTGLRYCINGVSLNFEEGKSTSELISKITISEN